MKFEHCFAVEVPLPPYREINGGRSSRPFYPQIPKVCQQSTADVGRGGIGITETITARSLHGCKELKPSVMKK